MTMTSPTRSLGRNRSWPTSSRERYVRTDLLQLQERDIQPAHSGVAHQAPV